MQYKHYEKSMLVYRGRKKNHNSSRYDPNIDNKTQNLKNIHRTLVEKSKNDPTPKHQSYLKHQRSSILSSQQVSQKQQSIKRVNNYGSMNQLNPYLKSDSRNYQSIYRSKNTQLEQKKLKNERHSRSRHNLSVQSLLENGKVVRKSQSKKLHEKSLHQIDNQVDKSVNFYINIQKLRNLKISSKNKLVPSGNPSPSELEPSKLEPSPYVVKKSNKDHNLSFDKRSMILKPKSNYRSINASIDRIDNNPFRFITGKKHPNIKPKLRYRTHQSELQEDESYIGNSNNGQIHNRAKSHASQNTISQNKKSNFRKHQFRDKSFIEGYLKGKQLGRGGFSKVWEGFHFSTKQFYAIKQIDTTNKYQTHLTQIWFGNYFFEHGRIKSQYQKHAGSQKLLRMFEYSIVDPKAFIVYESCDGSLGNMLYDIYEEEVVGEEDVDEKQDRDDDNKLYMIKYKHLYSQLKRNSSFLKLFIKSIAEALDLLAKNKIVHSDIKTENILLKKSEQAERKYSFKLIDYGSSFVFESLKQYKLATPEYMCPQLLNYILFENKKGCYEWMLEYVKTYENISAIDVWGLGCIVVELIHGLPLWLNNPTRILVKGNYETKKGLFAVNDRSFSKILQKQMYIVNNFDDFILNENNSDIFIDQQVKEVLKAMLNPNPKFRIRPHEIVAKLSQ